MHTGVPGPSLSCVMKYSIHLESENLVKLWKCFISKLWEGGGEGERDGRKKEGQIGESSRRAVWRRDKRMAWGFLSSRPHMTKRLVKGSPTAGCQK